MSILRAGVKEALDAFWQHIGKHDAEIIKNRHTTIVQDALFIAIGKMNLIRDQERQSEDCCTSTACGECDVDVDEINEYDYFVKPEIWALMPIKHQDKCLCLSCFEKFLGRELCEEDLNPKALGNSMYGERSNRLKSRIPAWRD